MKLQLGIGVLCLFLVSASSHAVTVSTTAVEDNFVRGGVHGNTVQNFNSSTMTVKSINPDFTRKTYIKFDLSGFAVDNQAAATFTVTSADARNDSGGGTGTLVDVFGLKAGAAGFNWSENSITFNNAPANDTTSATANFTMDGVEIGSFFHLYDNSNNPDTRTFVVPVLGDFLQADNTVTFMLAAGDNTSGTVLTNRNAEIVSSESTTGLSPTLAFDVLVPEPATATLGLMGMAGLLARRRRAA